MCSENQEFLNSVRKTVRILSEGNTAAGNQTNSNSSWGNDTSNCTSIPGCLLCPGNSGCAKCKPNFSKNGRGVCISCNVPKCQSCAIPDVCDKCNPDDTSLTLSIFADKCLTCDKSSTGPGCFSCSDVNICGQCSNGFQLAIPDAAAAVCVKCQIPNCKKCGVKASTTICKKCDVGYSISPTEDSCVQCLYPCDTCTAGVGPNNCATCSTPFFYKKPNADGSCKKKLVNGCEEVDTADESRCAKCEGGFKLESNSDATKCIWFCPDNCLACTSASSCDTCVMGFVKATNGTCRRCQAKGCAVCSENAIECKTCMRGFYDNKLGECKKCPGFCADCTSSTTCL